eukprot:1031259-Prymnesium_polylepis.1
MRRIYPDHVDAARFDATITGSLYERLERLISKTRDGVAAAVMEEPLMSVLANPTLVAADVA